MNDCCDQYNCPYYYQNDGCINPSQPLAEDCSIRRHLPRDKTHPIKPKMYFKFTFRDQWRHIPCDEMYPAWNDDEVFLAAFAFRKRHGPGGALVVFRTFDLIKWEMLSH